MLKEPPKELTDDLLQQIQNSSRYRIDMMNVIILRLSQKNLRYPIVD